EFTWRKKTYEQALEEYESLIKNDRITNAYARLFCDYVGIMLAILPVFLAVTRVLRDRKAQAEQVIFMAGAGSAKIVLSRFLAAVLMTVIPVIVLSCSTMLQSVYYAKSIQAQYDAFAFIRHIGFWLLPMILVSLSVGFFLTELTDSAIAILVQGAWWFVSIFMTGMNLVGAVGWNLVPRFNAVGAFPIYQQMKGQLMKNRLFYVGFSLLLLIFTIIVYNKKRKGEFVSVGTMLRNRKS
ncbi:MAG: ABC transporter permease, partial [Lachnospiraceae bacterium]|nr:ABC transporter permease [Lachnospiraceae bacterium]